SGTSGRKAVQVRVLFWAPKSLYIAVISPIKRLFYHNKVTACFERTSTWLIYIRSKQKFKSICKAQY
ncbi:MAG: hypothetical protein WC186_07950, partial [Bacteroidales bacterium]